MSVLIPKSWRRKREPEKVIVTVKAPEPEELAREVVEALRQYQIRGGRRL